MYILDFLNQSTFMAKRPYEKLVAWQEAHSLCVWTYEVTKSFPADERFAHIDQMRRSSSSVPTNIAEGNVRRTHKDKAKFFLISLSSLEELHYQFRLAYDLGYITEILFDEADSRINRTSYLLTKLRNHFV